MALHIPTFLTRTGTAIVFAIVMLTGLLWNDWAFLVLVSIIQVFCLKEYFQLMQKIDPEVYWPKWLPVMVQFIGMALLWFMSPLFDQLPLFPALLCMPILVILIAAISEKTGWHAAVQGLGGLFYIVLPMLLLWSMRQQSMLIPIGLILMIWVNDTMAYIVGSFIGKKPFSSISPKKTWEGTIGGALLTIAGAGIYGHFSHYYTMGDWMALALCAAVAGTAGDLLESKLKRMAGVKDSGSIMPGHGGALDRFDSLLVATPFAFTYAYIFMSPLPMVIF